MDNIISRNIDYIRKNLQIVKISFKGVSFGNKKLNLDAMFLEIIPEKRTINKIKKKINAFEYSSEIKKLSNSISKKLYKFRDDNLIKISAGEYAILKKEKSYFCKELDKLIENYQNITIDKSWIIDNKFKITESLVKLFEEFKIGKSKEKNEIVIEKNLEPIKSIDINIDKVCRFYDISEDLLRDAKFCETLGKELNKKGEKRLGNLLDSIKKYDNLCNYSRIEALEKQTN